MAVTKHMLAYAVPADLVSSWSGLASKSGLQVQVKSDTYVIVPPGVPNTESIRCRSGVISRGNALIKVCPSAGAHPKSKSSVAGKLLILVFFSAEGRQGRLSTCDSELAHEFGDLLIAAGATLVP